MSTVIKDKIEQHLKTNHEMKESEWFHSKEEE